MSNLEEAAEQYRKAYWALIKLKSDKDIDWNSLSFREIEAFEVQTRNMLLHVAKGKNPL
jgi:hypothetical protein